MVDSSKVLKNNVESCIIDATVAVKRAEIERLFNLHNALAKEYARILGIERKSTRRRKKKNNSID